MPSVMLTIPRKSLGYLLVLTCGLSACRPATPPLPAAPAAEPSAKVSEPARKFNFKPSDKRETVSPQIKQPPVFPHFEDTAASLGITHVYENGASPKALMVESTGGGCGWIDIDQDGLLDLYLTQGGAPDAPVEETRPADACFRQRPDGRFVEQASYMGIAERRYSQGVTVGDYDNDGFDDLFVANVGISRLYHNQGDGTFQEVTESLSGLRSAWSSSPAWGDIDRDGDLDLYVCNYAIYDPYHPIPCLDKTGIASVCHPRNTEPEPDQFFLNEGSGEFIESSKKYGLFGPGNRALGVAIADLNGDRWPDIYVANDTTANFYFVNQAGKTFQESATLLGGGYCATGEAQASMGVAFGDYDRNGFPDLCLSHFTGEHNTLYQNLGPNGLQDVSALTGLRELTLPKLGFGILMSDFNGDGQIDMFVANGHIDPRYADGEGYEMRPQLLTFDGTHWQDGSNHSGDYFSRKRVGRGAATADFDRDGDLDLCVVHQNTNTAILRNDSQLGQNLSVRMIGRTSNRNAIGAVVRVRYDGQQQSLELAGGTSFSASHERAVRFGLGAWNGPCHVEVQWPSGHSDHAELTHATQQLTLLEGYGIISMPAHSATTKPLLP